MAGDLKHMHGIDATNWQNIDNINARTNVEAIVDRVTRLCQRQLNKYVKNALPKLASIPLGRREVDGEHLDKWIYDILESMCTTTSEIFKDVKDRISFTISNEELCDAIRVISNPMYIVFQSIYIIENVMHTGTLNVADKCRLWHYGSEFIISDRNLKDLKFKDFDISDEQTSFADIIIKFFELFAVPIRPK